MMFSALLLVSALLTGGCGTQRAPAVGETAAASSTSSPAASSGPIAEAAACPELAPVHLPDRFGDVTAAYLCSPEDRTVPGEGMWEFQVVRRVTGGLDALLQAYRAPDAAIGGAGACNASIASPLVVWVHAAETLAVRAPRDNCNAPTVAAAAAYRSLTTAVVGETKLRQVLTQRSMDSGCSDSYKDMLAIREEGGSRSQSAPRPSPLVAGSWVCTYDVRRNAYGERLGKLTATRALTGAQIEELNKQLSKVVVDSGCSRRLHTRFALIQKESGSPSTLVALDGCAVQQDEGWWRGTDRLRSLLP